MSTILLVPDSLPALPCALSTAKRIEDLSRIEHPSGVFGPITNNANAQNGTFFYDRNFLLQFMPICKDKPDGIQLFHEIDPELVVEYFPRGRRPYQKSVVISTGPRPTALKEPKTKRVHTKRGKVTKSHDQAQAQPGASAIPFTHTKSSTVPDRSSLHDHASMSSQPFIERRR